MERDNSILTHKLADQEAATELEKTKRNKLTQDVEKLQRENDVLRKQEKLQEKHFEVLRSSSEAAEKTLLQSLANLNKAVSKLAAFDQRIQFAGSRIEFISGRNQDLMTRTCPQRLIFVKKWHFLFARFLGSRPRLTTENKVTM